MIPTESGRSCGRSRPRRRPSRGSSGSSCPLARIQFEALDLGVLTAVQLHTHPSANVDMSDLDVAWAIADFPGAISLIVPQFGSLGLVGWPGVAAYKRDEDGWSAWSRRLLADSIRIED